MVSLRGTWKVFGRVQGIEAISAYIKADKLGPLLEEDMATPAN